MNSKNPYEPPQMSAAEIADSATSAPKFFGWSITAVFTCALAGALFGLAIGAALGAFMPNYYRSVFVNGNDRGFDPLAVGMGQGLTQGVAGGAFIGVLLVGLFYWYLSRKTKNAYSK